MRIRYIGLVLAALMVIPFISVIYSKAAGDPIKVYVDREEVVFSINPILENGTTLVQLRPLLEALGTEITWNNEERSVHGVKDGNQFVVFIDNPVAQVNGNPVTLELPGRIVDNHTLVPLRFVSEATNAVVGWNQANRTISVYSSEMIELLGLSPADAELETNAGSFNRKAATQTQPSGFYGRSYTHYSDNRNCVGVCMDQLYFVNEKQVAAKIPLEGPDTLNCETDECLSYEIKDGQLILSNGQTAKIDLLSDEHFTLNGRTYVKYDPSSRMELDGTYITNIAGNLSNTNTFIFNPDGTFTEKGESEAEGTYTLINYSIILNYADGTVVKRTFYRPDHNMRVLQIGGSMYTLSSPDVSQGPYPDKLTTENRAEKDIFSATYPSRLRELNDIYLTLEGYQWAELDIHPDYAHTFEGFGNEGVIALTVKYNVRNGTGHSVNIASLESRLRVNDFAGEILNSANLVPEVAAELKPDAEVEKLAVFLFPKDRFDEFTRFELALGGLELMNGQSWFGDDWQLFDVWDFSE